MPPKRQRVNEDVIAAEVVSAKEDAALKILTLMKIYDFSIEVLMDRLTETGFQVSFSHVKYSDVARFVGLDRHAAMRDAETFELNRSRIPTPLFKAIVTDMDLMLMQFGLPTEHQTEEASSRFIAPIFNHLIGQFNFAIKNTPETILHGRISTKGRIEYQFVTFSGVTLVFVEVKLGTGSREEYLNAIAQIIAESDACSWNNSKEDISMPIFGILCDGVSFEFYKFDGSLDPPKFSRGRFFTESQEPLVEFPLARLSTQTTPQPFIRSLRLVAEIIFDVLLIAYSSSLTAFLNRSQAKTAQTGNPRKSLGCWEKAAEYINIARPLFREGETKRKAGRIQEANADTSEAIHYLQLSTNEVPAIYKLSSLMEFWDDTDVESI